MYIVSRLKKWVERPVLHQRVREVSQFSGVKDFLVSKEFKQRLAGSLSVGHHVEGQLHPPVLCISSRVPNCGELLPGRHITAAPGVVDDPILHAVVQNQTKEAVELPGLLERKPGQVFIPEDKINHSVKKYKKEKIIPLFMSLLMKRLAHCTAASALSA